MTATPLIRVSVYTFRRPKVTRARRQINERRDRQSRDPPYRRCALPVEGSPPSGTATTKNGPGRQRGEPRRRLLLLGEREHRDRHARIPSSNSDPVDQRFGPPRSTTTQSHPCSPPKESDPRPSRERSVVNASARPFEGWSPSGTATTATAPVDRVESLDDVGSPATKKHRCRSDHSCGRPMRRNVRATARRRHATSVDKKSDHPSPSSPRRCPFVAVVSNRDSAATVE